MSRQLNILYAGVPLGGSTASLQHIAERCGVDLREAWHKERTPIEVEWRRGVDVHRLRIISDWRTAYWVPDLFSLVLHDQPVPPETEAHDQALQRNYVVRGLRHVVAALPHIDGVVLIIDSQQERLEAADHRIEHALRDLNNAGRDPARIPLVFQLNKRDLPNAATLKVLHEYASWPGPSAHVESVATKDQGVSETLNTLVELILQQHS